MKTGYRSTRPISNNPYHPSQLDLPIAPEEPRATDSLKEGMTHELVDLVKLELTAEEMLGDEVRLAREYVKDDTAHFWGDLKQEFIYWELAAGQLLLTAADPTRVDWQENHWWGDEDSQLRH
jgi:hypothetical protein